jgi:hypothetical protein
VHKNSSPTKKGFLKTSCARIRIFNCQCPKTRVAENFVVYFLGYSLQDYTKEAKNSNSYREFAHCFSFTEENGYTDYFFSPGSGSFFMISVRPGEDSAIVRSRISIEPAELLVPEPETETETE